MTATRERSRSRTRAIELDDTNTDAKGAELENLIREVFTLNIAANAASKAYDKKRAVLLGKMKDANLTFKQVQHVLPDGAKIMLDSNVATPENEKANVRKLFKLLEKETFLDIVSATKKAIVDLAGEAVFHQVKEIEHGKENVSVSVHKEEKA